MKSILKTCAYYAPLVMIVCALVYLSVITLTTYDKTALLLVISGAALGCSLVDFLHTSLKTSDYRRIEKAWGEFNSQKDTLDTYQAQLVAWGEHLDAWHKNIRDFAQALEVRATALDELFATQVRLYEAQNSVFETN